MRRVVSIGDEALVVIPPVDWSGVECWSGELFQHRGSTAGMLVVSPVSRTGVRIFEITFLAAFNASAGRSPCFTLTMRSDVPCLSFVVYSRKWWCRTADRSYGRARSNELLASFRGRSNSGAGCRRPLKQPRIQGCRSGPGRLQHAGVIVLGIATHQIGVRGPCPRNCHKVCTS